MPSAPTILPSPPRTERSPGARASLALLLSINLFNYIDRYILAAVEPRIRNEFFADNTTNAATKMGLLAPAFMVSYMLTAPIFGWLGDRFNRWILIALGVTVWSLASGASGLAQSFTMLMVTRVFVGIGEAAYGPTSPTLIADLYPVKQRGAKLAWFYMAIPVGSAIGYAMGGSVAKLADSWRWPFYVVVPFGIVLGVWCLFRAEPARGQADEAGSKTQPTSPRARISDYKVLFRTPSYLFNLAGMTAVTFAIGGMSFWMPTYITEFRGLHDEGKVNITFGAILVVSGLAATLIGGWLADRLRARYPGSYFLVSGVGVLLGFPFFLLVLWTPFPFAWIFLFLAIFCLFLNTGPANTIIANVVHPSMRSTAYALSILSIHLLGDAISPPIIGHIVDSTRSAEHPTGNMNLGFLSVSAAILVGGVFWVLGSSHLGRDTERAPTRTAPNAR